MKVVFLLIVTLSLVASCLLGFNSGEISCAIMVQILFLIPPLFIMAPLFGQAKRCRKSDYLGSYLVWALGYSAELYCEEYREYFFQSLWRWHSSTQIRQRGYFQLQGLFWFVS